MLKKLFNLLPLVSMLGLIFTPVATHAAVITTAFSSGDLIKGSGDAVYYFANNGKRYVFPNAKTYFTWYPDFSTVKQIPDGMLSTIQLGGNVTYRPGVKMVKITTDPKVYTVDQGGFLRHVATEQLAETLFGLAWKSRIDDVPDAFFVNYRVGTQIQTASDYNPANVMTQTARIAQDKQLDETKITISIGTVSNGFVPTTTTIKRGTTVTWTNQDSMEHSVVGNGWSSGLLKYGESYTHTFGTAGAFDYKCGLHSVMQGTINVVN